MNWIPKGSYATEGYIPIFELSEYQFIVILQDDFNTRIKYAHNFSFLNRLNMREFDNYSILSTKYITTKTYMIISNIEPAMRNDKASNLIPYSFLINTSAAI